MAQLSDRIFRLFGVSVSHSLCFLRRAGLRENQTSPSSCSRTLQLLTEGDVATSSSCWNGLNELLFSAQHQGKSEPTRATSHCATPVGQAHRQRWQRRFCHPKLTEAIGNPATGFKAKGSINKPLGFMSKNLSGSKENNVLIKSSFFSMYTLLKSYPLLHKGWQVPTPAHGEQKKEKFFVVCCMCQCVPVFPHFPATDTQGFFSPQTVTIKWLPRHSLA